MTLDPDRHYTKQSRRCSPVLSLRPIKHHNSHLSVIMALEALAIRRQRTQSLAINYHRKIINSEHYDSLPPSQIALALADEGCNMISKWSFYHAPHKHHKHRRSRVAKRKVATTHTATRPNQLKYT